MCIEDTVLNRLARTFSKTSVAKIGANLLSIAVPFV